jgi:hypothetical protein
VSLAKSTPENNQQPENNILLKNLMFLLNVTFLALSWFMESRGKLPIIIASGLILWLLLLDSHVESAYIIIGNRIAPCTKILDLELK